MKETLTDILSALRTTADLAFPVLLLLVLCLFVYLVISARKALWNGSVDAIWWLLKLPHSIAQRFRIWHARRELRMHRARLLALKERAAAALIEWLMYEVSKGEITLEESYDLQKILAHSIAYPGLMPAFEPTFVKKQIKARRAQNGHDKAIPFPDREERTARKGGPGNKKIFQTM